MFERTGYNTILFKEWEQEKELFEPKTIITHPSTDTLHYYYTLVFDVNSPKIQFKGRLQLSKTIAFNSRFNSVENASFDELFGAKGL